MLFKEKLLLSNCDSVRALDGETRLQCARRELAEETGYQVAATQLERLGRIRPNSAILASRVDLYLAHMDKDLEAVERDARSRRSSGHSPAPPPDDAARWRH